MPQTTSAKAWTALVVSAAGVLALYGITVPNLDTINIIVGALVPLLTAAATYFTTNHPKA